ncbi:hypothetical protein POTOM_035683 [Populus tomentosa]|uniref:Peroxisomal membrane protein PMP22 n=1 Tax=Populus tomentosa TaxID=118781 RepID=A0A8X7YYY8_POPTO|nr:hypothetical protein POTOM_035683 [Populus tomentosa]
MSDVAKEAWRKYLIQLQVNPLRTKALTSGVIAGLGDALAQKISGIKKLQLRRLLLFSLFGFAYGGPFGHYLHKLMSVLFKGKNDSKTVAKMEWKFLNLLGFVRTIDFLSFEQPAVHAVLWLGIPWVFVKDKIKKDFTSVQVAAWKVGPMVAWVNNQFVPLQLRVIFQCFVGLCWTIFLNLKARSAVIKDS